MNSLFISNFYFRKYPYLDCSIILGYKSDLLRILPQDFSKLQTFLTDKFLAGESDIVVDVAGEKIATIGGENFKLGNSSTVQKQQVLQSCDNESFHPV
jgi:hypothetical protein